MTYTPMRKLWGATPTPAKPAKPATATAKLGDPAPLRGSEGPALAAFAGLAAGGVDRTSLADLTERAAIIEEGTGVPREWAESFARLGARPPPLGVDRVVWLTMMDAAGRFIDEWGSKAAALGWTAADLLGLDTAVFVDRRDPLGAAYYLIGADVLAITANVISIRKNGSLLCIRRKPALTALTDEEAGGS